MSFVPDPRTPRARTGRPPAGRSIGSSPPRLLHGRAANYGSIIVPLHPSRPAPDAVRRSLPWRFPLTLSGSWRARSPARDAGNVSGGWIFGCQGTLRIVASCTATAEPAGGMRQKTEIIFMKKRRPFSGLPPKNAYILDISPRMNPGDSWVSERSAEVASYMLSPSVRFGRVPPYHGIC